MEFWRAQRLPVPFLAYRLTQALSETQYQALVREYDFFRNYLPWGKSEPHHLLGVTLQDKRSHSLQLFGSSPMIKAMEKATGLPMLPVTETGFHYHNQGQPNGVVHHDYAYVELIPKNYGKLPDIRFAKHSPYARAFTLIYYLRNDWADESSDGGTGLYVLKNIPQNNSMGQEFSLAGYVPPVNNSALLFECSPDGFHSFMANSKGERCSVVTWYLSTADAMEKKFLMPPFYYENSIPEVLKIFQTRGLPPARKDWDLKSEAAI